MVSSVPQETKRQEQSDEATGWNLDLASVWQLSRLTLEQA